MSEESKYFMEEKLELELVYEEPEPVSPKISPENFIKAIDERKDHLTDEQLGRFIRHTLWTVTGKKS